MFGLGIFLLRYVIWFKHTTKQNDGCFGIGSFIVRTIKACDYDNWDKNRDVSQSRKKNAPCVNDVPVKHCI